MLKFVNLEEEERKKIIQTVYVNYTLDEFLQLLDVMKPVYDKVDANEPLCNVL